MVFGFGKITIEKVEKMGKKEDVKGLIKALNQEDAHVRCHAAWVLGDVGDSRAVEPLINALRDDDVVPDASAALSKIGGVKTVNSLIVALNDENDNVRMKAAEILGELGAKKAVEPLKIALNDENEDVRMKAALALQELGDVHGIGSLIDALQDENSSYRRRAARALGKSRGTRVVVPLLNALKDDDAYLRKDALMALDELGYKPDKTQTGAYYLLEKGNIGAVKDIGEPAIEPLERKLNDKHFKNKNIVARVLGEIGGEKVLPALSNVLTLSNADGIFNDVRNEAALHFLIISEKNPESITNFIGPLIEALKDDDNLVRQRVANTLINLYNQKNLKPQLKEKILSNKSIITQKHQDHHDCPRSSDCSSPGYHLDKGIGQNF